MYDNTCHAQCIIYICIYIYIYMYIYIYIFIYIYTYILGSLGGADNFVHHPWRLYLEAREPRGLEARNWGRR